MQTNTNPFENLSNQDLERMYPELYQKISPYIEDIAKQLRNQKIDENMLESIIRDIMENSGLSARPNIPSTPGIPSAPSIPSVPSSPGGTCALNGTCPADIMYDDFDEMEAIDVQRPMNFGNFHGGYPRRQYQNPYNRNRRRYPSYPIYPVYPQYYNIYPQDLIRILLFRQLFGYNPYY